MEGCVYIQYDPAVRGSLLSWLLFIPSLYCYLIFVVVVVIVFVVIGFARDRGFSSRI
jgi:hypothetical protein